MNRRAFLAALGSGVAFASCAEREGVLVGPDDGDEPKRLRVMGATILGPSGEPVRLRGANVEGVSPADAADLVSLGLDVVRMRVSFEGDHRDDDHPTALSASYRDEIDGWVRACRDAGLWMLFEMRGDDALTNSPALYDPSTPEFDAYRRAWVHLATAYRRTNFVAGFGLLAEPSVNKALHEDRVGALTRFHLALMDAITESSGDTTTPFFVGTDFNYDTMQYRFDAYHDALAKYAGRIVYEVNLLMPKPWIQDGTDPAGEKVSFPVAPEPTSFDEFLSPIEGVDPNDWETTFSKHREDPAMFRKLLSKAFLPWYLQWPLAFRAKFSVPFIVDQFGASADAGGQLEYERAVLDFLESEELHWCRWSYNAGSPDRMLKKDSAAHALYAERFGAGP
ncbi:MAG: cellulase family glycosylhydrolase [Polyangiaceae bacterium]